jgi:hypothetical protein
MIEFEPTLEFFIDVVKEQYFPVGNYDDQYMRWTTLRHERDQTMPEFTTTFHSLHTKLGIKDGATSGSKILWVSTQIHPNRNGVYGHLITGSLLSMYCQN